MEVQFHVFLTAALDAGE